MFNYNIICIIAIILINEILFLNLNRDNFHF